MEDARRMEGPRHPGRSDHVAELGQSGIGHDPLDVILHQAAIETPMKKAVVAPDRSGDDPDSAVVESSIEW